jgi:hypothetical protein
VLSTAGLLTTGALEDIGTVALGVGLVVVGGVLTEELLLIVVMPLPAGRAVHCITCP